MLALFQAATFSCTALLGVFTVLRFETLAATLTRLYFVLAEVESLFMISHIFLCLGRSERLAKYNQLLRIEEELGSDAVFAGDNWRHIGW